MMTSVFDFAVQLVRESQNAALHSHDWLPMKPRTAAAATVAADAR